jgi:hypothetical protein
MFKDKRSKPAKSKPETEVKALNASVNMVDVNVTTQNKTSEEQLFKD